MEAMKLKARIRTDKTLEWIEPHPMLPIGEVEVIVLYERTVPDAYQQAHIIEWSDKSEQIHWIHHMFDTLGIVSEPISIEELQRRMGLAGLAENEISRDLIAMRDE